MCGVIEVCDLSVGLAGVRPGDEMNLGLEEGWGRGADTLPACA